MKCRKWLGLLLAAVLCVTALPIAANAASGNPTFSSAFPDDNFRAYVTGTVLASSTDSKYGMATITAAQMATIAATERLDVSDEEIEDLEGIEYFTSLTSLECYENALTSLDLSKNTKLVTLDCEDNELTKLDISKNTELTTLYCSGNKLTKSDVSSCTALEIFDCYDNYLTSLDVSKNTELTELNCSGNKLTELDVSKNTELTKLNCSNNKLTELDLDSNTKLNTLTCGGNQLTSLDISQTAVSTCSAKGNKRTFDLDLDRTFDLSQLPEGFDASKASDWAGGTVEGTTLTVEKDNLTVTYAYHIGNEQNVTFTLNFTEYVCPSGQHNFGEYTVVTLPTATAKGQEAGTCSVCGTTVTRSIPASAEASVTVGGVKLTKDAPYYVNGTESALTADEAPPTGYNAYYDADSRTLTLNYLEIDNYDGNGIDTHGALTLVLRGTNSIKLWSYLTSTQVYNTGICAGTLVIQGSGNLSIGAGSKQWGGRCIYHGMDVNELYMKSGNVTVTSSYSTGVLANELQISGGSLIVVNSGNHVFNAGHIVIAGGTLTGYTAASIEHSDWSEDCHAVTSEPEFSGCGTYTIMAGQKADGEEAVSVTQGDTLKNYRYLQIMAGSASHTPVTDPTVAADCTTVGLTEGQHCAGCNAILTPRTVVNALGHSFTKYASDNNATCTADGTKTAKCDRCNGTDTVTDPGSKLDHTPADPVRENEVAATYTTDGSYDEVVYCSVCHAEISREHKTIAKTDAVSLAVSGTVEITAGQEELTCSVSAKDCVKLTNATLTFELSGEITDPVAEGTGDWCVIAQSTDADGKFTVVVGNQSGVTGESDLVTLKCKTTGKPGEASVTLTNAELSVHVGDLAEDPITCNIVTATFTTHVDYSIYDVNCDGTVDQLDITRAQKSYQKVKADSFWMERADINKDGQVSILDFILILNNYTKKA